MPIHDRTRRHTFSLSVLAATMVIAGCNSSSSGAIVPGHHAAAQTAYWDEFSNASQPQVSLASLPLTASSSVTNVPSSTQLLFSAGMAIDSTGRLWVSAFPSGGGIIAAVFNLPISASSTPALIFNLPSTGDIDHLTFDAAGNLWASDFTNKVVYEFTGPFTASGTLTPAQTVTLTGFVHPQGLALDASGNLYVSNSGSSGTNSIAVFSAPVTSGSTAAFYLDGLSDPGGLAFDAHGDLFASTNGAGFAIDEYDANDLTSGATPSVVDTTGLNSNNYEADMAFDKAGNLYVADCGSAATVGVRSYPTGSASFSSSMAPSATYQNGNITTGGCVWGIAIR